MRSTKKGIQVVTTQAMTSQAGPGEEAVGETNAASAVETLRVLPSGGELRFDPRGRLVEIRIPLQGRRSPHQYRRDALDEAEAILGQRLRLVSWKVQADGDYVKVAPVFLPGAAAALMAGVPESLLLGREPRNDA